MFLRRTKLSRYQQTRQLLTARKGYLRIWHYMVWRLKRLPGTPNFIATGLAIGIAINFWPILFTHLFFGYIFCRILQGSLLAMFVGTLAGNPWTFAIVYPLMYKIGKTLLGLKPVHAEQSLDTAEEVLKTFWPIESWHSVWIAFQEILMPMMLGGFLLGLPVTIATYYVTRNAVTVYQAQRRKVLLKKFEVAEHDIDDPHPEQQS